MSAFDTRSTASPWNHFQEHPVPGILEAALTCFVEHGYHGTVMRTIAKTAGLSVPGLYHHYESKHAMLVELTTFAMDDLYARSIQAHEAAGDSVEAQFSSHITCLVLYHAHRGDLAFLAASEIRSLEGDSRLRHIAARDRQQSIVDEIVANGVRKGIFLAESPADASRAIVTMCTGVAQWYRLGGPLTPSELAERYVVLARRALGMRV